MVTFILSYMIMAVIPKNQMLFICCLLGSQISSVMMKLLFIQIL